MRRLYLKLDGFCPRNSSSQRHGQKPFDVSEFLSDVLDPSQTTRMFQEECRLICVQASKPLWLLRCLTIFASPNPFVLFLRCLHHALNNRFNEAVSACVGFVGAVEKLRTDARVLASGDAVTCVRGLIVLSADAMIEMAVRIGDDVLGTGVSAWWRDRWCQTCASACLPCRAAASAPILRALHEHRLHLRILADSSSAYSTEESSRAQRQAIAFEYWFESIKAPVGYRDADVEEILGKLTETANGHDTACKVLLHLKSGSFAAARTSLQPVQEEHDASVLVYYRHQHSIIDSEINAHWREKIHSPSWACSPEFRMACVERCSKILFLEAKKAYDEHPSEASTAIAAIHDVALRFFMSVLKQLVHSPPAGNRCTRTEKQVGGKAMTLSC